MSVRVHVGFEGGLENDFNVNDTLEAEIPNTTKLEDLPSILVDKYLPPEKVSKFVDDKKKVLPGVLVMVNEAESELYGNTTVLQDHDKIVYISTLHGG